VDRDDSNENKKLLLHWMTHYHSWEALVTEATHVAVVFHAPCPDGFAAATLLTEAWRVAGGGARRDTDGFLTCFGRSPPAFDAPIPIHNAWGTRVHVVYLDGCPSRVTLDTLYMSGRVQAVHVLDHHVGNQTKFQSLHRVPGAVAAAVADEGGVVCDTALEHRVLCMDGSLSAVGLVGEWTDMELCAADAAVQAGDLFRFTDTWTPTRVSVLHELHLVPEGSRMDKHLVDVTALLPRGASAKRQLDGAVGHDAVRSLTTEQLVAVLDTHAAVVTRMTLNRNWRLYQKCTLALWAMPGKTAPPPVNVLVINTCLPSPVLTQFAHFIRECVLTNTAKRGLRPDATQPQMLVVHSHIGGFVSAISLRALWDDVNCLAYALCHPGGGGHPGAAAFRGQLQGLYIHNRTRV
jgi:hypothetical protein